MTSPDARPRVATVLLLGGGRALQVLIGLLSVRVATGLLSPSEFGVFNLLAATGSSLVLLLASPLGAFWTRKLNAWQRDGVVTVVGLRLLGISAFASIPLTAVVWLLWSAGSRDWNTSWFWSLWIVLSGFLAPQVANTYIGTLNLLGRRVKYVAISLFVAAGSLAGGAGCAWLFGRSGKAWYSGAAIPRLCLFGCIAAALVVARVRRTKAEADARLDRTELATFCLPLWGYGIVYALQVQSYPFLFGLRSDSTALGLFGAGLAVGASATQMFSTLLVEIHSPKFFREVSGGGRQSVQHAIDEYVASYVPALLAFSLFVASVHAPLGRMLLSPNYRSVLWIALIGVVQQMLLGLSGIVSLGGQALMKTGISFGPAVAGGIFTVAGLWVVLPMSPLLGGGVVLVAGLLVSVLLGIRGLRKAVQLQMPGRMLGRAVVLSLPLGVAYLASKPGEAVLTSMIIVGLAGVYALAVQAMLARHAITGTRSDT